MPAFQHFRPFLQHCPHHFNIGRGGAWCQGYTHYFGTDHSSYTGICKNVAIATSSIMFLCVFYVAGCKSLLMWSSIVRLMHSCQQIINILCSGSQIGTVPWLFSEPFRRSASDWNIQFLSPFTFKYLWLDKRRKSSMGLSSAGEVEVHACMHVHNCCLYCCLNCATTQYPLFVLTLIKNNGNS